MRCSGYLTKGLSTNEDIMSLTHIATRLKYAVKCHIPVERILMSKLTHEILGGKSADSTRNHSEYCVMEELDCEIIHGVYEN